WKKGDFCRAVFPEDNLLYEARILSINGDFCTVEFLGYDDMHDVDLCTLKESSQKHVPDSHFENSVTESEVGESTSIDSKSTYCKKEQYDGNLTNVCPSSDPSHLQIPCPPPVPPMPQSPVFEHNPNLSAMMMSCLLKIPNVSNITVAVGDNAIIIDGR
ncbi:hypothetical protein CDAR_199351, partial [Caerostris darwini]